MKQNSYAKPLMMTDQLKPRSSGRFSVGRIRPPEMPGLPSDPMQQMSRGMAPPQDVSGVNDLVGRLQRVNQDAVTAAGQPAVNQELLARLRMGAMPADAANERTRAAMQQIQPRNIDPTRMNRGTGRRSIS